MTVLRFFKDGLTGDECANAWNGTDEMLAFSRISSLGYS